MSIASQTVEAIEAAIGRTLAREAGDRVKRFLADRASRANTPEFQAELQVVYGRMAVWEWPPGPGVSDSALADFIESLHSLKYAELEAMGDALKADRDALAAWLVELGEPVGEGPPWEPTGICATDPRAG